MIKNWKSVWLICVIMLCIARSGYSQYRKVDSSESEVALSIEASVEDGFHTEQVKGNDGSGIMVKFLVLVTVAVFLIIVINMYVSKKRLTDLLLAREKRLKILNEEKELLVSQNHDLSAEVRDLQKKQVELERKSSFSFALLENIRAKDILSSQITTGDIQKDIIINLGIQNAALTSMLEADNYQLNPEKLSLEKLVDRLIKYLTPFEDQFKLELISKDKENCMVVADLALLQLIILNLLMNAITHSERDSKIQLIIDASDNKNAILTIIDYGSGIPKKHFESIFKKYFHLDNKNKNQSAGLGLYYNDLAIKTMKGSIQFESKVGEGSKFSVLLPLADKLDE